MSKAFASRADLEEKKVSFTRLADCAYAYTAEGDPNTGIVIGDDGVMVIDAQATPVMAQDVIARIREVTDKPIRYVVMSHYHAVRVLGASAYGAEQIIASRETHELIVERGEQDFKSELERFPRLFQAAESIPGLTWPTMVFDKRLVVHMGSLEVHILHLGRGHTKGDTVVWLPAEKILFSGDLVEYGATPYTGDAYLSDWPATLDALRALGPEKLVPGRGAALETATACEEAIAGTQSFLSALFGAARKGVAEGRELGEIYRATYDALKPAFGHWVIFDHCLPFDVTRATDEASGIGDPRIWTAERDAAMWQSLEGGAQAAAARKGGPAGLKAIQDEHVSYSTIIHLFQELLRDLKAGRMELDLELFSLIVEYMSSFIETCHHPKEEKYLFRPLRERAPEARSLIDRLMGEHAKEQELRIRMEKALADARAGVRDARDRFLVAGQAYVNQGGDHNTVEEKELIPLALARLLPEDWAKMEAAVADPKDPAFGEESRKRHKDLLHRITFLAPEPHGLGGRR